MRSAVAFAVVMCLASVVGRSEAAEKPFHASFAGTTVNKSDFSFDGDPQGFTFFNVLSGKSSLGAFDAQLLAEFRGDGFCALAGGGNGFQIAAAGESLALTIEATGDQVFLALDPSVTSLACVDFLATGNTTGQTTLTVRGGTGRFAGATGTIVKTWKTIHLAPASNTGGGSFGSFTGTLDGSIETK